MRTAAVLACLTAAAVSLAAGEEKRARPAAAAVVLSSPAEVVALAVRDILAVSPADRPHVRYLAAYNFAPEDRPDCWRVLNVHANGLSREPEIVPLVLVPASGNALARLDLRAYGWSAELWDKLGGFDVYFHARVKQADTVTVQTETETTTEYETVYVPADPPPELKEFEENGNTYVHKPNEQRYHLKRGTTKDGTQRTDLPQSSKVELGLLVPVKKAKKKAGPVKASAVENKGDGKETLAAAPWLSRTPAEAKAIAGLIEATGSTSPVLRADWFFRHTAIQEADKANGQIPGYYDFLRLKNQKDFEEAIGLDLKAARGAFKDEVSAVVVRSTVALNNRRLVRFGKIGGGAWFTLDAQENTGKKNYLRIPDTDPKAKTFLQAVAQEDEFTATEAFGPGPNGLMIWWLANNKGERQNAAPDFIASDGTAPGTDRRVHANLSCVRCHSEGVRPIKDVLRTLISDPLAAKVPDYDTARRLRQLYSSDLDRKVRADQQVYADAVATASGGLKPDAFAKLYSTFWARYQERDFTLDRIALETGYPREHVLKSLDGLAKAVGSLDPVAAGLLRGLAKDDSEVPIRSEMFEEIFPVLMTYLRNAVPVSPAK